MVWAIDGLRVAFPRPDGEWVWAVDGVTLRVRPGETVGLVGESGCGKSVTALASLRLLPAGGRSRVEGQVTVDGLDVGRLGTQELRRLRGGRAGMVFQEPMTGLNPLERVGIQLADTLTIHQGMPAREARLRAVDLLRRVRMTDPERMARAWPAELSGGQRQRVMIAMALAGEPRILIADEPTTALDVTVQAAILGLMKDLQRETGMGILLITHDLGIVRSFCDRVVVMRDGRFVEEGPVASVFESPSAGYTKSLIDALPSIDADIPCRKVPGECILAAQHVRVEFGAVMGRKVVAVDDASLELRSGETLGIVGESGSGKSTLGRALFGLEPRARGAVTIDGRDWSRLSGRNKRAARRLAQVVFQDPLSSLRPGRTVGELLDEPLRIHGLVDEGRAESMMTLVGLDAGFLGRMPHELSGGQRQRVAIARALMTGPKILLADEPVSALDVSVQAQILDLLADLRQRLALSMVFISHDLAIVRQICDRVLVMHGGRIVEQGATDDVLRRPRETYTRELVASIPR